MPNFNQTQPQSTTLPPAKQVNLLADSIVAPPDSTSLLYFMRQEQGSEFQWLELLLGSKEIEINQTGQVETTPLLARRELLQKAFQVDKSEYQSTPPTNSTNTVGKTEEPTPIEFPDTSKIISTPDTTSTIDTASVQKQGSATLQIVTDSTLVQEQDSTMQVVLDSTSTFAQPDSALVDSMFTSPISLVKEVVGKGDDIKEQVKDFISTPDLMLVLLLFSLVVSTWARVRFPQIMRQMFIAILTYSESYKIYRESNRMARYFYWAMGLVFHINLTIFLVQNITFFKVQLANFGGIGLFSIVFAAVSIVYFVKKMSLRTIGQLFMAFRVAEEYWFSISTINRVLGISLFPLLIVIPYLPESAQQYAIQGTWGLIALSFIFRLVRGLRISIEKHLSVFYMILYFCTLEILPMVLITKYVLENF